MFYKASKVIISSVVRKYLAFTIISGLLTAFGANAASERATEQKNNAPSASAGSDRTVTELSDIVLTGSGSDTDGTIVSYNWTQTAGTKVNIENPTSATISLKAPATTEVKKITLQLTVTDNEGSTSSDSLVLTIIPMTPEQAGLALENAIKNIGYLAKVVDLPPLPDKTEAIKTVAGVDSNNNGTRDELEHITYQAIKLLHGVNIDTYNQMLSILNMIQPQNSAAESNISSLTIYCAYQSVPNNVKARLSLSFLYSIVLDTQPRKTAHYNSLAPSPHKLGPESCS